MPDTPAAVSLMADNVVILFEPFEESRCSTAGPGTRTITIKGYQRHSSTRARQTGSRHEAPPLLLLLPGLHLHSITMSVCTPPPSCPSATGDVTPAEFCAPIYHPFLLSHSSWLQRPSPLLAMTSSSVSHCILRLTFGIIKPT